MSYISVELPSFDVNESEATITEICVKNKQKIEVGQKIFEAENTKAVNQITSTSEGYLLLLCDKFSVRKTGDQIALIFDSLEELNAYDLNKAVEDTTFGDAAINATKKAIELAKELNIDLHELSNIKGSDVIKVKDVQDFFYSKDNAQNRKTVSPFKYDRERVVIIGAGNGAEVVIDILRDDYEKEIVGLVDDNVKKLTNYTYPVFDCGIYEFPDVVPRNQYDTVIISIGSTLKSMKFRKEVFEEYRKKEVAFTNAISKSADIRRGVKLGIGNLIGAQSYIGTLTQIGDNNSISYATFIGHHNIIGSHNLIAPGFVSSGSVEVGSSCIITAGVVSRNCVRIGDNVVLPVGYDVINSIPDHTIIQQKLINNN